MDKNNFNKSLSISNNSFKIVTMLNEEIYIPGYISAKKINLLKKKYEKNIYNFIATRVFYKKNKIYEYISSDHLFAIALAKIFHNLTVYIICDKNQKVDELLFKVNKLNNIEIIDEKKVTNFDESSIVFFNNNFRSNIHQFIHHECDILLFTKQEEKSIFFTKELNTNRSIFTAKKNLEINLHKYGTSKKITHAGLDIIIPMYNSKKYIISCIDSLLISGRDDIRVLVVNDGSTDGSGELVEEYYKSNNQVILLNKLNGGCASARNYGRQFSTSSHIAFVDADDFVDPNYFELLYDLAQYTGKEIVQGNFVFYEDTTANITIAHTYDEIKKVDIKFFDKNVKSVPFYKEMNSQPTIWRKVFRRDYLDSKRFYFPECIRAFDDFYFHIMTAYFVSNIYVVPEINYYYRQHSTQDIKQGDSRHYNELYMFYMILNEVMNFGRKNFKFFTTSFINSINWSISNLKPDLVSEYINSAAEILVVISKIYGENGITDDMIKNITSNDMKNIYLEKFQKYEKLSCKSYLSYMKNENSHPNLLNFGERKSLV